jgi:uncharacterized protein (TIGR03435 family)
MVLRFCFCSLSLLLVLAGLTIGAPLTAQAQTAPSPTFAAASVKANISGNRYFGVDFLPGGRLSAKNMPLGFLPMEAYQAPFRRVVPTEEYRKAVSPEVRNRRYDIEAVAEKDAIPAGSSAKVRNEKLRLMLQNLLADRFKLAVHREVKNEPVYAIVLGKGGPKVKKSAIPEADCMNRATSPLDTSSCHVLSSSSFQGLHGEAVDMTDLARALFSALDRPIVDRTGLSGLWIIQTSGWADPRTLTPPTEPQRAGELANANPDPPTLFAVLEELGLKLEPQTAPIETVFIDYIEPPSEN